MPNRLSRWKITREARRRRELGATDEDLLRFLHEHQLGLHEVMDVLLECGISLRDVKSMVTASPFWAKQVAAQQPLHEDAIRVFRDGEKRSKPKG